MRAEQLILRICLGLVLAAGVARAEPYLGVRSGAKCSDCHVNETGGGMRTPFAFIHAHDILKDLQILPIPKGVKSWNGEINQYVALGGDLRARNTTTWESIPGPNGRVPENRAFRPHEESNELAVQEFLGYLKVDLIPDMVSVYGDFDMNGGVADREGFGLIRGFLPWDFYVKAGRLFPAYGLRIWDDQAYIRSRTGYTFETPEEGGEIGLAPGPFFIATSITNGTPSDEDVAVTLNAYTVLTDLPVVRNVLAGGSFARQSPKRSLGSFYAGSNIWTITYLAEFDLIDDRTVASAEAGNTQYAAYAEVNWLLFDWLNVRGQFDFAKVANDRDQVRYVLGLEPFIDKFIQPRIQYRINNGPGNKPELNQDQLVIELHLWW